MTEARPFHPRRGNPVIGPDGTKYDSQAALARALGVSETTVAYHLGRYGNADGIGAHCVRTMWRDVEYPSLVALSKASGRSMRTSEYHLTRYGNVDRLGVGKSGTIGNKASSQPVTVGPCKWPSKSEMAADLGVSRPTLRAWLTGKAGPEGHEKLMAAVMAFHARTARAAA